MSKILQEAIDELLEALKHARNQIQHPDQLIDEAIAKAERVKRAAKPTELEKAEALGIDEAWEELCGYSDRTSPEDYPDMALITMEELASFMERAAHPAPQPTERKKVLEEALRPFAEYMGDNLDKDNRGNPLRDNDGVGWVYLTHGDFRRARSALAGKAPSQTERAEGGDE